MRSFEKWCLALALCGSVSLSAAETPGQPADQAIAAGRERFVDACAFCHGLAARGNGMAAAMLEQQPPDLTRLSRKNGGKFPLAGIFQVIDGRADVYLDEFMDEYVLAYQLRGDWRRPLDRYDVDYILIESGASFESLLEVSDEWTRVYRDEQAVIFVRAGDG